MYRYSLTHLSDPELLRNLADVVARDRTTTAGLLAHLAEVEARKLHLPAGYPSMHAYCVGELHMSEDAASDRIQAARLGRAFPALFAAIADGQLNLTGVLLLGAALTPENWPELLEAAEYKSKREIEELLAKRGARSKGGGPELPLSPPGAGETSAENRMVGSELSVPERITVAELSVPERITAAAARFPFHAVLDQETRDMLAHAMSLLSHQVPSGNLGQVLRKLLEIAIPRLEKRKFGARSHRRNGHRQTSTDPRYVPADVKKAVWNRDGGQCTFLSEAGRRCPSRRMLEFDHAVEVARGGVSTVENVRLRCRAHNQYTAEQSFGAGFMLAKRKEAEHKREEKRSKVVGRSRAEGRETAEEENDVVPWLRQLGYRADQARHAAQHCAAPPDATLEDRVKAALRYLAPPHRRVAASS